MHFTNGCKLMGGKSDSLTHHSRMQYLHWNADDSIHTIIQINR
jgi:hypothetical protein